MSFYEHDLVDGLAAALWREATGRENWAGESVKIRARWNRYARAGVAYLSATPRPDPYPSDERPALGTSAQDARHTIQTVTDTDPPEPVK